MKVRFKGGKHKGYPLKGKTFGVSVPWQRGLFTGHIKVYELDQNKPVDILPIHNITCRYEHIEYINEQEQLIDIPKGGSIEDATVSDKEKIQEMKQLFSMINELTLDCINGTIRGLVVTGPAGCGKTTEVMNALNYAKNKRSKFPRNFDFTVINGVSSTLGLYQTLYHNRLHGQVTVFDDSDDILFKADSLNLLKHALDSAQQRRLSWNTESATLKKADIPRNFEYSGSIIFLTNLKFDSVKGKIGQHLSAIMSRCYYLDLKFNTDDDKMLRIKQLVGDGMLNRYGFNQATQKELMLFMNDHKERFRELSPRMLSKVADLRKSDPSSWKHKVTLTCMNNI